VTNQRDTIVVDGSQPEIESSAFSTVPGSPTAPRVLLSPTEMRIALLNLAGDPPYLFTEDASSANFDPS